jgi:hypothetical protein
VPKSIDQIKSWLDSSSHLKCVLADIGYYNAGEQTLRLSTRSYYDGANEYIPNIIGGISFSESLSADLSVSINYGTLELENTGGTYDHYLNYIWKRRPISLYLGDPSWSKSDFILVFSGLVDNLVSSGESTLQLTIVDGLEQLNESLTTKTTKDLTGDYTVKTSEEEKLVPILFGEVFNLSPIIVDTGRNYDTGPWTGILTKLNSTIGISIGHSIQATDGVGVLGGASRIVTDILDNNSILYTATGGTRPRPGIITNVLINNVAYQPISGKDVTISYVKGTGGPVYKITDGINTPYLDEIIEVRDKAAPIEVLTTRSTYGEFMLKNNVFGTVTCSARSFPAADCTIPNLIKHILKNYGKNTLTDSDIDFTNISTDRASYKAGIYLTDKVNILEVCNQLARSINCALYYSPITINTGTGQATTGKIRLVELKMPTSTVGAQELNDSLMLEGTLQITESFAVKPAIKLAYCKNYTQQSTDLALALNPDHGNIFKDEYWYIEAKDTTVENLYNDTGQVQEEITHLIVKAEAEAEAAKRLQFWKTPRYLVTATYLPHLLFLQLGETVVLKSNRFGLSAGKPGIIYSINRDWLTGFVEIGVLI